ncbi:MAG: NUDIX hydrolase [Actinobacteria bacterium 13_2_20CM_2_71_6]|nr:MAG: NUDIX hydrolase [Actinobacteria bacterium 13_2_20CM_2_71_6]
MRQRRRIAVYGVCRDEAGRLLLVHGSARNDLPSAWSLPGGGLEHGERPYAGAIREFAEETGLDVEITGLHSIVADLSVPGHRQFVIHTDRVLYDVKVTGGELCDEVGGTSDRAAWIEPGDLAGLRLMPYLSRLVGLPTDGREIPAAAPHRDPTATRIQRFAAYGLVTDPAGRILLTRIAAGYPGAGTWHLPGGGTDFGEQPTTGLLRELVEETDQLGRVTGLLGVTDYHNPRAMGPERRPMDWHTVRALYRVVVDVPSQPSVVEAAGGSTAEARWFTAADLGKVRLNEFAKGAIARNLG